MRAAYDTHGLEIEISRRMNRGRMSEISGTHQIEIVVQIGEVAFIADDVVLVTVEQVKAVCLDDMALKMPLHRTRTTISTIALVVEYVSLKIHPEEHGRVVATRLVRIIADSPDIRAHDVSIVINEGANWQELPTIVVHELVIVSPFKSVDGNFQLVAFGYREVVVELVQA